MSTAGWYSDPAGGGGMRYWDGSSWSAETRPAAPPIEPVGIAALPQPAAPPVSPMADERHDVSPDGWSSGPRSALQNARFLRALYDFGFSTLVAPKVVRFVYALGVVLDSLGAAAVFLFFLIKGPTELRIVAFVLVPITYVVEVILLRLWMEVLIVVFRMGEDVRALRLMGERGGLA